MLLGYILTEYDFQFESPTDERPHNDLVGNMFVSDPNRRVSFRKRDAANG